MGEIYHKERLLLLVEKEYIKKIPHFFWFTLSKEILNRVSKSRCSIIYYKVDKNNRRVTYYDKNDRPLRKLKIFNNFDICFDFIYSGDSFYKEYPVFLRIMRIVRVYQLLPTTVGYFKYDKVLIYAITFFRNKLIKFIAKLSTLKIDNLDIFLPAKKHFYSCSFTEPGKFSAGNMRILPYDMISLFTRTIKSEFVKGTPFLINGNINSFAIVNDITTEEDTYLGNIDLIVKNNKVKKFVCGELDINTSQYRIVHLSIGSNPFIFNHKNLTQIAERMYGWICVGIENKKRSHIDICFKYRVLPKYTKIIYTFYYLMLGLFTTMRNFCKSRYQN